MYKAMHQSMRDSEKLANLSDFAFRVWEMGCVAADLTGRITANPKKFWAQAMPLVAFDEQKYASAIAELKDLVHFYAVEGRPYMVYHDHDEHNKGTKNLKNLRPSCPPPPPTLCYCIVYTPKEDGGVASTTPVLAATAPKEEKRAAQTLAALWNDGPGEHLNGKSAAEKIQAAIDVGVNPQVIEQAFWDHKEVKGRKIWEVLDPLRTQGVSAGKSWGQIIKEASNG